MTYVICWKSSENVKCGIENGNPHKQNTEYFVNGKELVKDSHYR
jgi:hypothetical protein